MSRLDKEIFLKEAGFFEDKEKKKQHEMFNAMKQTEIDKNVNKIRKNKIQKDVVEKVMRDGHVQDVKDLRNVLRSLERS